MTSHSHDADVLIAGGGVAGSSLAILLGRRGLTVELFERATFPREKPCGEGLMPAGVAVLERLGLAGAVGGEPFCGIRYHVGRRTLEARFPETNGQPTSGRAQRRLHLDRVLFQAAAATPGVTAHTGVRVEAPLRENGRVVGLCVEGTPRRAPLVVAADGVQSGLRRALGLAVPAHRKRFGTRVHFRLPAGQAQPAWVDVFMGRGYELYVASLPERELLVAALADAEVLGGPIEQTFHRWCRAHGALAARLEGAAKVTDLLCAAPLGARARAGVAPGIVLLGDAAGSIDPITGGGMTHALLTAELLAEHVARNLGVTADDWLWEFDRERQALLRDYRILTRLVLWLADHPRAAEPLVSALRFAPGLVSQLIGVAGGMRSLSALGVPAATRAGSRVSSSSPAA